MRSAFAAWLAAGPLCIAALPAQATGFDWRPSCSRRR